LAPYFPIPIIELFTQIAYNTVRIKTRLK
jgi:hypothetical protein